MRGRYVEYRTARNKKRETGKYSLQRDMGKGEGLGRKKRRGVGFTCFKYQLIQKKGGKIKKKKGAQGRRGRRGTH